MANSFFNAFVGSGGCNSLTLEPYPARCPLIGTRRDNLCVKGYPILTLTFISRCNIIYAATQHKRGSLIIWRRIRKRFPCSRGKPHHFVHASGRLAIPETRISISAARTPMKPFHIARNTSPWRIASLNRAAARRSAHGVTPPDDSRVCIARPVLNICSLSSTGPAPIFGAGPVCCAVAGIT